MPFVFKLLSDITLIHVRPHLQFIHNEPLVFKTLFRNKNHRHRRSGVPQGQKKQSKSLTMSLGIKLSPNELELCC